MVIGRGMITQMMMNTKMIPMWTTGLPGTLGSKRGNRPKLNRGTRVEGSYLGLPGGTDRIGRVPLETRMMII